MMKKVMALVLAVLMLVTVVGCSTPSVAISVDGRDYSTAEYLAYLYNNANMMYYYYSNYSDASTMWDQSLAYTNPYTIEESTTESQAEVKDEDKLPIKEYIQQETKDQILYLAAVEALMKENKFEISEENKKAADDAMAQYSEGDIISKGFSLDTFKKVYLATNYAEDTLFKGIYGKGGKQEVPEKDIKAYFDKNYLAYEIIQITTVDSDGNSLSDEEIAKIRSRIDSYYDVYKDTGNFDKAIKAYSDDNAADSETTEGIETVDTAETTEENTEVGGYNWLTGEIDNVTSNNSENVQTMNAETATDKDLVKAVQSVAEGDVKVVEYNQGGTSAMIALIYRIDPDGKGRETYYDDSKDTVIEDMKKDDFKKIVIKKRDELQKKAVISDRAIKMCDPQDFFDTTTAG